MGPILALSLHVAGPRLADFISRNILGAIYKSGDSHGITAGPDVYALQDLEGKLTGLSAYRGEAKGVAQALQVLLVRHDHPAPAETRAAAFSPLKLDLSAHRLSNAASAAIGEQGAEIYVSAATAWELATKVRIGKLPDAQRLTARFEEGLTEQGFLMLPITIAHGHRAGWLMGAHRDPFDRMLAAQALIEDCAVITNDEKIARFGVRTIW